jgi:DNA-directed RNA polymerase subunit RPC12/RpoP
MTEYICPTCFKNFGNKKDHYEKHINKKKRCITNGKNLLKNTQNLLKNTQSELSIQINQNDIINNNEKDNHNTKYQCIHCLSKFTRKFNLDRHLKTCKNKNESNNENKIKLIKIDEKLDLVLKQNEELKKENEELKKQIKIKNNKSFVMKKNQDININILNNNNIINNQQNIINNQKNIINFSKIDYNNVDKKLFINPIMNARIIGKGIILKMIENIYINDDLPEYQNVIITDKNRGYVKIYNNGQWKTDNLKIINTVIDGIVEHSKTILEELNELYINNLQASNRLNTSKKYINLCDLEYLEELEYDQENNEIDNKKNIKRCKDFRDMVFRDTINLFHDNKNILLKPKNFDLIDF